MMDHLCEVRAEGCTGRAVHIHHRKLRSQGGNNAPENLRAVCSSCHTYIHMHPAVSYARGWLVHSWDTP